MSVSDQGKSLNKPMTDSPKTNKFVTEIPQMNVREAEERFPGLVPSRAESHLVGNLTLNYIPLKDDLKVTPSISVPVYGVRKSDGVLSLIVEFSVTDFVNRVMLIVDHTIECTISCTFMLSQGQAMQLPLLHIEPMDYAELINAVKEKKNSIESIYRPFNTFNANDHIGTALYKLHMVGASLCVERIELDLRHTFLTAWTHSVNDQLRIIQGGLPIIEMANFNIQRHPPGNTVQNETQNNVMNRQVEQRKLQLPPQFPESAKVPVQPLPVQSTQSSQSDNIPKPPTLEQLKNMMNKNKNNISATKPTINQQSTMTQPSTMTPQIGDKKIIRQLRPPEKTPV